MYLIRKASRRLHYPTDVIVQCVRWYLAYALSLRNIEEMMAEPGIIVDHSTLHRWVIRMVPLLDKVFRRHKRSVGGPVGAKLQNATSGFFDLDLSKNHSPVRWLP
ncbi:putative transposase remnant [Yersinia pekkanenii]|uniref:Transposase remnant n=1 Tax=Yersinia pekkanenii TaxID=1288385 RepID=A0ABP1ZWK3_9GAMM|nr:putative transposase remnant [Yersinia pekkanenii]